MRASTAEADATGGTLAAGSTLTRTSSRPVFPPGSVTLSRNDSRRRRTVGGLHRDAHPVRVRAALRIRHFEAEPQQRLRRRARRREPRPRRRAARQRDIGALPLRPRVRERASLGIAAARAVEHHPPTGLGGQVGAGVRMWCPVRRTRLSARRQFAARARGAASGAVGAFGVRRTGDAARLRDVGQVVVGTRGARSVVVDLERRRTERRQHPQLELRRRRQAASVRRHGADDVRRGRGGLRRGDLERQRRVRRRRHAPSGVVEPRRRPGRRDRLQPDRLRKRRVVRVGVGVRRRQRHRHAPVRAHLQPRRARDRGGRVGRGPGHQHAGQRGGGPAPQERPTRPPPRRRSQGAFHQPNCPPGDAAPRLRRRRRGGRVSVPVPGLRAGPLARAGGRPRSGDAFRGGRAGRSMASGLIVSLLCARPAAPPRASRAATSPFSIRHGMTLCNNVFSSSRAVAR